MKPSDSYKGTGPAEPQVKTRTVKLNVQPFFDRKMIFIVLLFVIHLFILSGLNYYLTYSDSRGKTISGSAFKGQPLNTDKDSKTDPVFQSWVRTGNDLYSKGLYSEAAQIFEQAVLSADRTFPELAGIAYKLGKINLEYLKKPSGAAKWFFLVSNLEGDEALKKESRKLLVNSLERAGKSQAARNILKDAVTAGSSAMTGSQDSGPAEKDIVASLGDKEYTFMEFKAWAEKTLKNEKGSDKSFDNPDERQRLIQHFLGRELLYDSGLRKGYENDSFILAQLDEVKKDLIANRVYTEEIIKKLNPDEEKLRLYYKAHPELGIESDPGLSGTQKNPLPFEKVSQKVLDAYIKEAGQKESMAAIGRLLGGEDVKIIKKVLFKALDTEGLLNE
jgi:hypothetical protein